ncbi:MAG: hypothetical protein MUF47_09955 [Porphyrobacter sp.]|jgi:hypothetical protein|nr:hypothetical protein [Porphyrobacter sp.]
MRRGRKNGKQDSAQNAARNGAVRKPPRRPLALHPLFGIVLGLWGAALGGLVTLVLPRGVVLEVAAMAGLAGAGVNAPFVLAAIAALVLGGVMFACAGLFTRAAIKSRRRGNAPSLAAKAVRHVQTIDPERDLGSSSLDEPVEAMPFAGLKPVFETDAEPEALWPAPPLELDLAEFGALPGRNAVWVEDRGYIGEPPATVATPEPEPAPAPAPQSAPAPAPEPAPVLHTVTPAPRPLSPSAIAHLRAVPTSELSLVQMVERFAAALHEHQSIPPGSSTLRADQAARDAALAEALKALAAFSPAEGTPARSEPLRAALARLQELRGAA